MGLSLVPRNSPSALREILTPLVSFAVAMLIGALVLMALGRSPQAALDVYVIEPLTSSWAVQEILLKATPLILIAMGLLFCVRANRWNIGAEGQYVAGGICGGAIAVWTQGQSGSWILPAMLIAGAVGGLLYGLLPALLRNRFGISEILSSLMLVYVAELFLDFLVRGPWRDPKGMNMPITARFSDAATMDAMLEGGKLHWGVALAVLVSVLTALVLGRSLLGFAVSATGEAPRAANFAGFNDRRITLAVFAISGALAGLAGIIEVSAQLGQLQPSISQGYGFTAIIIVFLGRQTAFGALIAALALSLLLIGAEGAQIMLKLPFDMTRAFMGLLLLCVLAGEALIRHRLVWRS